MKSFFSDNIFNENVCTSIQFALKFVPRGLIDNLTSSEQPEQCKLEQLECLCSEDTPAASWLPILLSHIGSQVKRRHSQSYKFKEFAKILNFRMLKQTLHVTHPLKLLDKMCKYERDPMSIVEDTERTRFCPQTDKVKPVYPPFNFVEAGGIISLYVIKSMTII